MNMHDAVDMGLNQAVSIIKDLRTTYGSALNSGKAGLNELHKTREQIEPKIRKAFERSIDNAHHFLDELNHSLADRSVPPCRRSCLKKKVFNEDLS